MNFFSDRGLCLFGKHRGVHARQLPAGWAAWARENIHGFSQAYDKARQTEERPGVVRPKGRTYVISRHKRCYEPGPQAPAQRPGSEDGETNQGAP